MKPRYDESPLLAKAVELEQRIDRLVKAKTCPECEGKGDDCKCKKCPECNGKVDKMGGCMKMGCDSKMAKAQPGYEAEKITDVNPSFHAESGGQTKSGYFTTNGKTIQTEDGKPKKKKADKKSDLARLGDRMNPHSGTGVEREDSAGEGSSQ